MSIATLGLPRERSGPESTPAGTSVRQRRPARPAFAAQRQAAMLLATAEADLGAAIRATETADRYAAAHRAALRAAGALLAVGVRARRYLRGNTWDLLAKIDARWVEWADYFRARAGRRQLAEAGIDRVLGTAETAELLHKAGEFILEIRRAVPAAK